MRTTTDHLKHARVAAEEARKHAIGLGNGAFWVHLGHSARGRNPATTRANNRTGVWPFGMRIRRLGIVLEWSLKRKNAAGGHEWMTRQSQWLPLKNSTGRNPA
jgi:hypothetical protein